MNENFKLYRTTKDLSFEIIEYSKNIPKNMVVLKNNLQKSLYDAIKCIHLYVINMNEHSRTKQKYLKDLIVELSMVDYYLEILNKFKLLGKNNHKNYCDKLEEIRKLAYGVINSEKK